MAPVTVDSGAIVGGGSGNTGWSARSTLRVPRIHLQQLQGGTTSDFSTGTMQGESFTPTANISVSRATISIWKQGSPTGNMFLEIRADSGGLPAGTALATSDTIDTASVPISDHWRSFTFSSPPALTSGTKYWLIARHPTGGSAGNQINWHRTGSQVYAGHHATGSTDGTTWSGPFAVNYRFGIYTTDNDLYQVTQDTALHVWKSTDDGASWAEQNSAGAPSVSSSTRPFSADWTGDWNTWLTNYGLSIIGVAYFSNTNTVRLRPFDCFAATWSSTDINSADATTDASNERNIRVALTPYEEVIFYTSVADDADLEYVRQTTNGAWSGQVQTLAVNSTEASTYADVVKDRSADRFLSGFFYDVSAGDFTVRTLSGTTQGTATDLDATAADVETEHASAVYQVYADGASDKALIAFIDADGSVESTVATLGVTSASIGFTAQTEVTASTSYAGRHLATCKFDSDVLVFASTATGIDVYRDAGITGTWSAVQNWKTGLTTAALSTVVPITGVGVLVSYVDNGNTVVDLWVATVDATGSVSTGSLSVSGQSITGTSGSLGSVSTGTLAVSGQTVSGTATHTGTVSTGAHAVSGQSITGTAGSAGVVSTGSLAVSGQSITGTTGSTNQISTGALTVSGQSITGSVGDTGTISTGSLVVSGQSVSATSGTESTISTGSLSVSGQSISGTVAETGQVSTGSLTVSGQSITGTSGSTGQVSTGAIAISGQSVSGTTGSLATISTGSLTVSGQDITGTAEDSGDVTGIVDTGGLNVSGQSITGTTGSLGIISTGTVVRASPTITATTGTTSTVSTGSLAVSGQSITATDTGDTTAIILTGVLRVVGNTHNGEFTVVTGGIVIPTDADHIQTPLEFPERSYVIPHQRYVKVRTVPAARFHDLDDETWP